jgi:hypothetical protein
MSIAAPPGIGDLPMLLFATAPDETCQQQHHQQADKQDSSGYENRVGLVGHLLCPLVFPNPVAPGQCQQLSTASAYSIILVRELLS